jgi:hypothetical protein
MKNFMRCLFQKLEFFAYTGAAKTIKPMLNNLLMVNMHKVPTDGMLQSQHWKDVEGLQGFQQYLSKLLTQISQVQSNSFQ